MSRTLLLAAALGAAGCAPMIDPHKGVSQIDRMRCDYEARRATAGVPGTWSASFAWADLYQRCLDLKQHEINEREGAGVLPAKPR